MLAQAVILAGGKGTRLGAITASTPKPLLPVAGRAFVEHLMQELSRYGFERVTLLTGHLGEQFKLAYDGKTCFGMPIDVLIEPMPLGTGGSLRFAADASALDPDFLLINGDSWIDVDLTAFAFQWTNNRRRNPALRAQMLLHCVPDRGRYGAVAQNDGLVSSFLEKPAGPGAGPGEINAGVYILDRNITGAIPRGSARSLEADVLPDLVRSRQVAAEVAPAGTYFIDIGLPQSLEQSRQDLIRHRQRPALFLDRDGTLNIDRGYTHRPVDLAWQPDAREAVRFANDAGYYVFVVTNQSGVARGYYEEADVSHFHLAMQAELFQVGGHIDAFAWCPHHPESIRDTFRQSCRCRKPAPGMIEDLIDQWPVDLRRSLLIGDAQSDMDAARAAGISGVKYSGGSLLELVKQHVQRRNSLCG